MSILSSVFPSIKTPPVAIAVTRFVESELFFRPTLEFVLPDGIGRKMLKVETVGS
jgi:hypothetical protein